MAWTEIIAGVAGRTAAAEADGAPAVTAIAMAAATGKAPDNLRYTLCPCFRVACGIVDQENPDTDGRRYVPLELTVLLAQTGGARLGEHHTGSGRDAFEDG